MQAFPSLTYFSLSDSDGNLRQLFDIDRHIRYSNGYYTRPYWAQFHNNLIRLKFNPKYFKQNYTYFRQFYRERLKQHTGMQFTYPCTLTSAVIC